MVDCNDLGCLQYNAAAEGPKLRHQMVPDLLLLAQSAAQQRPPATTKTVPYRACFWKLTFQGSVTVFLP